MSKVEIPDAAILFIVSRFMLKESEEDVPLVVGVSTDVVEKVLELFIQWADLNKYVKDGMLVIGGQKID